MSDRAPALHFVSATRRSPRDFEQSALGRSLARLRKIFPLTSTIATENSSGLPEIYNRAIEDGPDDELLVFVHDDLWIEDFHFDAALSDALGCFDVVGVAGNTRRLPGRPTWSLSGELDERVLDQPYLSGRIAHGPGPCGQVLVLGPVRQRCALLDGVLLAVRRGTLRRSGARFDPQFAFHFYDLDFCRTATAAGLTLGTWGFSVTHQSGGDYGAAWQQARPRYFAKWTD